MAFVHAIPARQVRLIEMTHQLGSGMESGHLFWVTQTLDRHKATVVTGADLQAIEPDGKVRVKRDRRTMVLGPFDSIVLATGYRPDTSLRDGLRPSVPEVYVIGDAAEPRSALEAMREAAEVAITI